VGALCEADACPFVCLSVCLFHARSVKIVLFRALIENRMLDVEPADQYDRVATARDQNVIEAETLRQYLENQARWSHD